MKKKLRTEQIAEDLRILAPLLKQRRARRREVPERVLQGFRASLAMHIPPPPPPTPEPQLVELTLQHLAEQPSDSTELLGALKHKSARCYKRDYEKLLVKLMVEGLIFEDPKVSYGRTGVLSLTDVGRQMIGLRPLKKKQPLKLFRDDE